MSAVTIDGKQIANTILTAVRHHAEQLKYPPLLAIILVGSDEGSLAYIRQKQRAAKEVGMDVILYEFPEDIASAGLSLSVRTIQQGKLATYATSATTALRRPDALIVQRPLPGNLDAHELMKVVDPKLDVDGFHPKSPWLPPIGEAVLMILKKVVLQDDSLGVEPLMLKERLGDRKVVLLGYGDTAGQPIAKALLKAGIDHEVVRKETPQPSEKTRQADILITATGQPHLVTKDWVKPGAFVIDVGIARLPNPSTSEPANPRTQLVGDCGPSVTEVAGTLTPVPGGVGPVNVACLLLNVVRAAQDLQ